MNRARVAVGEVLAGGQSAGEMHQRRALHHGVVDVEEGGRGQIRRRRLWAGFVDFDQVRDSGLGAGIACQRLHGGLVTIANGHMSTLRHRFVSILVAVNRAQVVLLTRQGCSPLRTDRGTARRAGARAGVRPHDHRRRYGGCQRRFRTARRVRRPAAGGAARRPRAQLLGARRAQIAGRSREVISTFRETEFRQRKFG